MDIYSYLKKDHKKVSDMMEDLLATKSVAKRKELFEQIKLELTVHAETEEATFYAALEEHSETEEKAEHGEEEHGEIKEYLAKLSRLSIEGEKWMEQFGEFKHCVTHHVEEEEGEIFEKAKKVLSEQQAKDLAKEMDAMKKEVLAAVA